MYTLVAKLGLLGSSNSPTSRFNNCSLQTWNFRIQQDKMKVSTDGQTSVNEPVIAQTYKITSIQLVYKTTQLLIVPTLTMHLDYVAFLRSFSQKIPRQNAFPSGTRGAQQVQLCFHICLLKFIVCSETMQRQPRKLDWHRLDSQSSIFAIQ